MAALENGASSETESQRPLNVLIAGAGIGGLTAALALRRQGHKTTLFEQSRLANEIGAAINIAPNCNGILRRLGLYLEHHGAVDSADFFDMDQDTNVLRTVGRGGDDVKLYGHPYHLMHRAHLHKGLKDLAVSEEGKGTPSVLHTASRVASVDVETATVTLENGESFSGDMIIGADGIHSQTRSKVTGAEGITPFGSGMSGFRFLIDMQKLLDDPVTASLPGPRGSLIRIISAQDSQVLVMYPCQNNEVMNCMLAVPTEVSGSAKGSTWRTETSKAKMLEVTSPSYGARARAVLNKAESGDIRLWELMDMATLPTWITGKLALMGDAAHPFTPWRGQGGAMAIEDAASLGAMFPLGTTPEQVPERLELYQQCRRERAHFVQDLSRRNSPLELGKQNKLEADGFDAFAAYGFDEWKHSEEALAKATATAAS